jgi:hypothetical protein
MKPIAQRKAYGMATLRASPRTPTEKRATLLASRRERRVKVSDL